MKSVIFGGALVVVVSILAALVLETSENPSSMEYTSKSGSVRLDQ